MNHPVLEFSEIFSTSLFNCQAWAPRLLLTCLVSMVTVSARRDRLSHAVEYPSPATGAPRR